MIHPDSPTPNNPQGFWQRYWHLILILVAVLLMTLSNKLFESFGTLIYIPVLVFISIIGSVLLRRVTSKTTTEEDIRNGNFNAWYDELPQQWKVLITIGERLAYFWIIAHIAAAVISR